MKPKNSQFKALLGLTSVVLCCTASAAEIDVVGTLTAINNTNNPVGTQGARVLTSSQTWTANNEYFLTDRVFIPNGLTLTIEPGTRIYGSIDDNGTPANRTDDKVGSLIAARGGRLVAEGTAAAPIIFSSVKDWESQGSNGDSPFDSDAVDGPAPTAASGGQWGGVVLLGNAYVCHLEAGTTGVNQGNAEVEGFVPLSTGNVDTDAFADAIEFGFDATFPRDDDDDSGVLRYVSIRHGGYEFASGREINGLTLAGVGASTVVDHIEVFANQDDGIEFFGGTVSTSYLCLAYNQDDNFDFDSGHTGNHQFLFSIANPGFADGGFEHDGIESVAASQASYDAAFSTLTPVASRVTKAGITLTKPRFFNATIIGPGRTNTFSTIAQGFGQVLTEKGNHGFIFDDFYNGEIYNSVIDDFAQDLAFFRDNDKSYGPTPRVAHNTLGRFGSAVNPQADTAVAAGTIGTSGNLSVTVTGGLISATTINVAVLSGDTAEVWGAKVSTAINADPTISAHYKATSATLLSTSGTPTTTLSLSTKVNAANDTTLNLAIANGTASGVTAVVSSTNAVTGGGSASVNPAVATSYFTNTNTLNLFMNATTGAPTDSNSAPNVNPLLTTYTRDSNNFLTAIDPRPASGSPLLKSNGATFFSGAPMPVTFRGAFGSENWAAGWTKLSTSGVLLGGAAAVADADGDGISDAVETANSALGFNSAVSDANTVLGTLKTTAQFDANFTAGQTSVTSNPAGFSLYTAASILDVRSVGQVVVAAPAGPGNVTLTLPVEKSTGLTTWAPAGNMTLSIPKTVDKEFYRITIPE